MAGLFQPYSKARREDVPDYVKAEIEDARNRAQAKMSENAIRSQNLIGGGMLYNAGMKAAGKSPISDFIEGVFDNPAYDPTQVSGVDNMPDMSTEMGGPEVVESTGSVTPYGAETGMVADPLTTSMEANAGVDSGFALTDAEMALNDQYRIDTMARDAAGTLPDGVTAVDPSISGVPPVGDPLTSATTATEAANVANTANAASTAATASETAAALESAMAANAAATGAAGAAGSAGSAGAAAGAGGGAMSGALAALGPLGAIAALAALFG